MQNPQKQRADCTPVQTLPYSYQDYYKKCSSTQDYGGGLFLNALVVWELKWLYLRGEILYCEKSNMNNGKM